MMFFTFLFSVALAGKGGALVQALPTGQTAATIFAHSSLTAVGTLQCSKKTVEVKCGTVLGAKTCSLGDTATHEVFATTTNIVVSGQGFKLTTTSSFCDDMTMAEFK